MKKLPPVAAVVFAAGRASRFGAHKLLLPAGPGHTVLSRTVATALASVAGDVVVVLGRDPDVVRLAVTQGNTPMSGEEAGRLHFELNPDFEQGLGSSVAAGVRRLLRTRTPPAGALLLLGDQPLVGVPRVEKLLGAYASRASGIEAVAATTRGKRRNPVIISPALLPQLTTLSGDTGARSVLDKHPTYLEKVELGDGEWVRDIDEWSDYASLAEASGWDQETAATPRRLPTSELAAGPEHELRELLQRNYAQRLTPNILFAAIGRGNSLYPALFEGREGIIEVARQEASWLPGDTSTLLLLGDGSDPARYLRSLRTAALWTLSHGSREVGRGPS